VTNSADSRPEQRAEAYYLLALACQKQGNHVQAYQYGIKFDRLAPKIPAGHWTRAKMAEFSDKPVIASNTRPSHQTSAQPIEPEYAYYLRVQAAYQRRDLAAAGRELRNLDRFTHALRAEQLGELRRIACSVDLSAAGTAFDRRQYSSAATSASRALERIDELPGDDSGVTLERARALYYLAASYLRTGSRERAQRYIEVFGDRCAALGPDHPWTQRMASLQAAILNSIPTDPLASDSSEETADSAQEFH
jgi:hypothetical protein